MVKIPVSLPVPLVDLAHFEKRRSKYLSIFEYRSIQGHEAGRAVQLLVNAELVTEKVKLRVKRPSAHVAIEVGQIRVVLTRLVIRRYAVRTIQELDKRRFADTDVTGDRNRFTHRNELQSASKTTRPPTTSYNFV